MTTSAAQLGAQRRSLNPDSDAGASLGKMNASEAPNSFGVESVAPSSNNDVPNPFISGATNTSVGQGTTWAKRHLGRVLPIGEGTNKTNLFGEPSQPINYQGIGA